MVGVVKIGESDYLKVNDNLINMSTVQSIWVQGDTVKLRYELDKEIETFKNDEAVELMEWIQGLNGF